MASSSPGCTGRGCLGSAAGLFEWYLPTTAERARAMPGDELVPNPVLRADNGLTVDAPVDAVWPWLAQMGADRGGWYSYDRLDNGGIPSVDRIVPDLQEVAVGDVFPALPGADDAFVVAEVEPPTILVLTVPDGTTQRASWAFLATPTADGGTRLHVRARLAELRVDLPNGGRMHVPRLVATVLGVPVHAIMQRRQLLGLQRRLDG